MRRQAALLAFSLFLLGGLAGLATAEPTDSHGQAAHGAAGHAEPGHGEAGHGEEHAESHGPPLVPKLVNTVLFFGALGWFAGPWVLAQLRRRRAQIENDLSAAQRAREQAEARLAAMDARLTEVEGEVKQILEKASAQAEAEKNRILDAAKAEAQRLLESAEVQVGELEEQASRRLREQAADHAVTLARELVTKQLGDKDRTKLFDDYLSGLKKAAG